MLPQKLDFFKYTPTDEGVNLQAVDRAVNSISQQHDTNIDKKNLIERSMAELKMQASPTDKRYVDELSNKISSNFEQIATTLSGNKRWDMASQIVDEQIGNITKDTNLLTIKKSYENFTEDESNKAKLRLSGHLPIDRGDTFDTFSVFNPDGTTKVFQPKTEPAADYYKDKQSLLALIEAEVNDMMLPYTDESPTIQSMKRTEITEDLINRKMPDLIKGYKTIQDTSDQEKFVFSKKNKVTGELADAMFDAKLAEDFKALGKLRIFKKEDLSSQTNPAWQNNQYMERQLAGIQARAAAKGSIIDEVPFWRPSESAVLGEYNTDMQDLDFTHEELQKGAKFALGNPLVSDLVILGNDTEKSKVKEDDSIVNITPIGINIKNVSSKKDLEGNYKTNLDGAIKSKIELLSADGTTKKYVTAYVPNNDSYARNSFKVLNTIEKKIRGTASGKAFDGSELTDLLPYPDLIKANKLKAIVIRKNEKDFYIKYRHQNNTELSKTELEQYGLKPTMHIDDFRTTVTNNIYNGFKASATTPKDVSGQ